MWGHGGWPQESTGTCERHLSIGRTEPAPGCCYQQGPHLLEVLDPPPREAVGKDLRKIYLLLQRNQWDVLIRKKSVLALGSQIIVGMKRLYRIMSKSKASRDKQLFSRWLSSDKWLELSAPQFSHLKRRVMVERSHRWLSGWNEVFYMHGLVYTD